jgi:hypothetical protein
MKRETVRDMKVLKEMYDSLVQRCADIGYVMEGDGDLNVCNNAPELVEFLPGDGQGWFQYLFSQHIIPGDYDRRPFIDDGLERLCKFERAVLAYECPRENLDFFGIDL